MAGGRRSNRLKRFDTGVHVAGRSVFRERNGGNRRADPGQSRSRRDSIRRPIEINYRRPAKGNGLPAVRRMLILPGAIEEENERFAEVTVPRNGLTNNRPSRRESIVN